MNKIIFMLFLLGISVQAVQADSLEDMWGQFDSILFRMTERQGELEELAAEQGTRIDEIMRVNRELGDLNVSLGNLNMEMNGILVEKDIRLAVQEARLKSLRNIVLVVGIVSVLVILLKILRIVSISKGLKLPLWLDVLI